MSDFKNSIVVVKAAFILLGTCTNYLTNVNGGRVYRMLEVLGELIVIQITIC